MTRKERRRLSRRWLLSWFMMRNHANFGDERPVWSDNDWNRAVTDARRSLLMFGLEPDEHESAAKWLRRIATLRTNDSLDGARFMMLCLQQNPDRVQRPDLP